MPELPDVLAYISALRSHVAGHRLERIRLSSPFVLRTVDPPIEVLAGRIVRDVGRIGKRILLGFDEELFLVVHLMIAGRLKWRHAAGPSSQAAGPPDRTAPAARRAAAKPPAAKITLATFEFAHGRLYFTEASSKKRASLQLVHGAESLAVLDPGGLEPLEATPEAFREALTRENHTVKRALTDPHLFSGIGNAYSDEILHAARLSPLKQTRLLTDEEIGRLHAATRATLRLWIDRLSAEAAGGFPEKVTAFRDEMAVHGRFRLPCPVCGAPVQRIVYAENECNYCARCQTGGRLLADRSLSRLLKADWPRSIDEV